MLSLRINISFDNMINEVLIKYLKTSCYYISYEIVYNIHNKMHQ
jgi:hypothetical protein